MSDKKYQEPEVCEACGVAAEVGYIIGEGDEVATITITGPDGAALNARLEEYLKVAREVNENVKFETTPVEAGSTEMTAKLEFEVSAEKIIFELNSRSLNN